MKTPLGIILFGSLAAMAPRPAVLAEAEGISRAPSVSYHALAARYSPVIYQDIGCPESDWGYADYITRVDYDGDYVGNNNWDNLGYPSKAHPLPAYVYYAVMETATHYFIWYALFHPADDFHCHTAHHENDLEGMVMCVYKDGSPYGQLRTVQLQAHNDFFQYRAPGVTVVHDGEDGETDDIDGDIELDFSFFGPEGHPRVYVEGGGHGIRHKDTGDWPSVIYYYKGEAEDPDDVALPTVPNRQVGYDLLSIFAEMWERRKDCGPGRLFDDCGSYEGRRFSVVGLGRKFDGDDYSGPMQGPDMARAPWDWDDNDDGPWYNGDWFMDPADYHWRLKWDEPFAGNYIFHPFGYDRGYHHLGGDLYNGKGGKTTLLEGPYLVVFDISVLSDQSLTITPGREIRFDHAVGIISYGTLIASGVGNIVSFTMSDDATVGIRLAGQMRVRNGGCIRFD